MATAPALMDSLHARRRKALEAGGAEKLEARRAQGSMGARERLVAMRGPEHWGPLVDEVFAGRIDEGRALELRPEDAVVPALQSCSE